MGRGGEREEIFLWTLSDADRNFNVHHLFAMTERVSERERKSVTEQKWEGERKVENFSISFRYDIIKTLSLFDTDSQHCVCVVGVCVCLSLFEASYNEKIV